MWIEKVTIKNFRFCSADQEFKIEKLNIPDGRPGSGITVFLGENGCGKTSILDAIALPFLSYKADSITLDDFNNPREKIHIDAFSESEFEVSYTMPKGSFKAIGLQFEAGLRARGVKAYLSTPVVSDQKFIKQPGSDKPKDGSPDLRVSVNNPFKGKRFDENDFLYLDKNRTYQTRSGTFNQTRFDRLMEDFDYQYIKSSEEVKDHNEYLNTQIKTGLKNDFLADAISRFKEISGIELKLDLIENWKPFKNGAFVERKENNLQISLDKQGSGFEMIFSLIYSFFLSQQSKKQLITLIDEPELHLHPKIQGDFVEFLLESSKSSQVILTSHSPLLIKQLLENELVKVHVLSKGDLDVNILSNDSKILPYISSNEINYLAFGLATVEYHNELYGYLQELTEKGYESAFEDELVRLGSQKVKYWQRERNGVLIGQQYQVTLQTFIRNKIHHPENRTMSTSKFSYDDLLQSIKWMIEAINNYGNDTID